MTPRVKNPEQRFVSDAMLQWFPQGGFRLRVPLGPAPPGVTDGLNPQTALRMARPWRPEVDAVAFHNSRLVLVEAKILRLVDGIAKLPLYRSLVPTTPELGPMGSWPVEMWLATPWSSEAVDTMARSVGVEIHVYTPAWIAEYVQQLHDYWTTPARERRELLRRARQMFGLE